MSGPHPLNQAVVAQALHDLRNRQLRRVKAMGFADEDLHALKQPALASLLANTHTTWCTVAVNRKVVQRLLNQAGDFSEEILKVDRFLLLGVSTEIISKFFGLTHQEIALRRRVLGLPKRKGRHPVLTEAQEADLWRRWSCAVKAQAISLDDETKMLDITADLAEAIGLPMSVIWHTIGRWIAEGLT